MDPVFFEEKDIKMKFMKLKTETPVIVLFSTEKLPTINDVFNKALNNNKRANLTFSRLLIDNENILNIVKESHQSRTPIVQIPTFMFFYKGEPFSIFNYQKDEKLEDCIKNITEENLKIWIDEVFSKIEMIEKGKEASSSKN